MKFGSWRKDRDQELDEEIESHLRMASRDRVDLGESHVEARQAALKEFGNVTLVKEVTRGTWGWNWLEQMMRDISFGARMMRRSPAFTAVAVATLALGIGATTAIFSVLQAVLLQSLPFPQPARLVLLAESLPKFSRMNVSWPDFVDWRAQTKAFDEMAAFNNYETMTLATPNGPLSLRVCWASASLFQILGTRPVAGRIFSSQDDKAGAEMVALVSHRFWQAEFGSDPDIVGKTLNLEGGPAQVVGVLPPEPRDVPWYGDVYIPVEVRSTDPDFTDRGNHPGLEVLARLAKGATVRSAEADMDTIMTRLGQQYPASDKGEKVAITALEEWMTGGFRGELLMLMAAVALILLLASANIAHLVLTRSANRAREFAVRASLGAGSGRIIGQLVVESLLLSVAGGTLGVLLAALSIRPLVRLSPYNIPRMSDARLDTGVLVFALTASLVVGLIFGISPAVQVLRTDVMKTLKSGGAGVQSSLATGRLRSVLFVGEIAVALVVLCGSGLLIRSIAAVMRIDPGFLPNRLIAVDVSHRSDSVIGDAPFFNEALSRLQALPGVESASAAMCPVLGGVSW
ncbi:MAG TPA: ABC transporter permease, partial [Blastocatellia bacterium]